MALELHRLLEKVNHMDITLIGGNGGIHNLVSWVHMIETTEAASFLEGGEIAVITGLGVNSEENLLDLLNQIHTKKASGVIINTGPFLEEIPQSAIDFCNQHDLPLMRVPWKIHLSEIMRIFCFCITKEDQLLFQASSAFKNALFFPEEEELYIVPLSQRNFNSAWTYAVCVMNVQMPDSEYDTTSRLESLTLLLDNYARHRRYKKFSIFTNDTDILIVVGDYKENELITFINDMVEQLKRYLQKEEQLSLGVGRLTKSIRCLYKSYQQAKAIQKLQANDKIDSSLFFYPQLGLYQLLLGIENREIAQGYYDQMLGSLISYDKANDSDLTVVLKSYLSHNGSVKDTADELFVHRNTVNYKLSKISDLLGLDLSALQSRLQLMVAFMIEDML